MRNQLGLCYVMMIMLVKRIVFLGQNLRNITESGWESRRKWSILWNLKCWRSSGNNSINLYDWGYERFKSWCNILQTKCCYLMAMHRNQSIIVNSRVWSQDSWQHMHCDWPGGAAYGMPSHRVTLPTVSPMMIKRTQSWLIWHDDSVSLLFSSRWASFWGYFYHHKYHCRLGLQN